MKYALGLVEVRGLSCAVEAADAMVKSANVTLAGLEAARGNGMMTVKVIGDVGAVRAAVESGKGAAMAYGALVSAHVIARPADDVDHMFIQPAQQAPEAPAAAGPVPGGADAAAEDGAEAAPESITAPESPAAPEEPSPAETPSAAEPEEAEHTPEQAGESTAEPAPEPEEAQAVQDGGADKDPEAETAAPPADAGNTRARPRTRRKKKSSDNASPQAEAPKDTP